MAYLVSPTVRDALLGGHEMTTKAVCLRAGTSLGEFPVRDVSVYATYATRGGRDGDMRVDRDVIESGLLNPLTDEVIIYTGIRNVIDIPIFAGRVQDTNSEENGSVDVPLMSRGSEIIAAQFEVPWPVTPPLLSTSAMIRIIQDVNPDWAVDISRAVTKPIPANLVFEYDRGGALDQIAQGASHIWQPDRTGGFTIYENPYAIGPTLASQSVVTLQDGENGCLVRVFDAKSRQGIYNSITVVSERVDNTAPIRVTVRDVAATSQTRWGGPFGKANRVVKNQNPISVAEAQALATRILRQSLALQRSWRISIPHMPLLDPGDVFTLWYRDEVTAQVVESIQYSGDGEDLTTISSRELTLADASLVG